jgi:hypothetical protein
MRLSSDKLTVILTYQRTKVNKKVTKNGKNLTFVVFGHPERSRRISSFNQIRFTRYEAQDAKQDHVDLLAETVNNSGQFSRSRLRK